LRRLLLDQSAPLGLRTVLTGFDVTAAFDLGWERLANGRLLAAAEEAGFSILLSADQNIWHQNRMAGRKIALVIIGSNRWATVRERAQSIVDACERAGEGSYTVVPLPKAPRPGRPQRLSS
jgi:hypothetical protein